MVSGHLILIWTLPWEMKDWEWAHQASFGEEEEYQCNFIMLRNYLYTISQTPKQHVVISKCFFQPFPHPPKMIYSHHFLDTCRYKYSNATKNRCASWNLSSWVNSKSICLNKGTFWTQLNSSNRKNEGTGHYLAWKPAVWQFCQEAAPKYWWPLSTQMIPVQRVETCTGWYRGIISLFSKVIKKSQRTTEYTSNRVIIRAHILWNFGCRAITIIGIW